MFLNGSRGYWIASKKGGKHFPEQAIESVYREIMSACRAVQKTHSGGFLGPAGTYTNMAAQNTFGLMVDFVDASTVEAVFDAVARGNASFGVVPIENSTEGGVHSTLDQLAMTNLMIHRSCDGSIALLGEYDRKFESN